MSKEPLVSAVMLTGKDPSREPFCQMALKCFLHQNWDNKELVIVNHGDWVVNTEGWPNVREIRIEKASMGLMRQRMLDEAEGKFVIQWDDDDISMPNRMRVQVTPMRSDPTLEATFLGSQIRYSLMTNCALVGWNKRNAGIDGTVCHKNVSEFRYKDVPAHEDSIFRKNFKTQFIIQGDRLHIRLHHGDNIMGAQFIMYDLTSKTNVWRLDTSHARLLSGALERFLGIRIPSSGHRRVPPYILPANRIGTRVF